MISAERTVDSGIIVPSSSVLHPKVSIHKIEGGNVTIGEKNVIEELCSLTNSSLGDGNLLEVGCTVVNSSIGSGNVIGVRCEIFNSSIGNNCFIMTSVRLTDATVPDSSCVYVSEGGWRIKNVELNNLGQIIDAYREKLSVSDSPHCIAKNFKAN